MMSPDQIIELREATPETWIINMSSCQTPQELQVGRTVTTVTVPGFNGAITEMLSPLGVHQRPPSASDLLRNEQQPSTTPAEPRPCIHAKYVGYKQH